MTRPMPRQTTPAKRRMTPTSGMFTAGMLAAKAHFMMAPTTMRKIPQPMRALERITITFLKEEAA